MLQYYCYLNLAVATILAFKPKNFEQYRRHGVEDWTFALSKLDLSSTVLKVKKTGAVPLFHSIFSGVPITNQSFRFGEIIASFHMCNAELTNQFSKTLVRYRVQEDVKEISGMWFSEYSFSEQLEDGSNRGAPRTKIEKAMPILISQYRKVSSGSEETAYRSKNSWFTEKLARQHHAKNGMQLINYGGHATKSSAFGILQNYYWHGAPRKPLLPTLPSTLMMAFSLASIVRYRPKLLETAIESPLSLLMDSFSAESDHVFIPSIRNLLYREEMVISSREVI